MIRFHTRYPFLLVGFVILLLIGISIGWGEETKGAAPKVPAESQSKHSEACAPMRFPLS